MSEIANDVVQLAKWLGLAVAWEFLQSREHDPEKWRPVFGKDHAQTKS
jgi:hypothetical protein